MDICIDAISLDQTNIDDLAEEAMREGFPFINRLIDEWARGTNRFDAPGELFVGGFVGGRLAAIGGLNDEPYEPAAGRARLRHLYVAPDYRRLGVGRKLLAHILRMAEANWTEVRLRTETARGAAFYEAIGFTPLNLLAATHEIRLPQTVLR
ncbi:MULTISPECIES: GNAT family N-acetyltransferase [Sphingobium]|uniref:GNAT family N-acetyltransferase n=1 Tax=Sphingobium TaxID=165695 RepID=UPI0015EC94F5|nr:MULTISPECIES: GNAT family N-acetyltransferase [Sphingobium]MCW2363888.1 GNAT superfamily N-acetyltransferase [Sphingobium sp. B10D3B]MCW2402715.1 GNAT superfamily N-acetyltransferase [Sphingobium sp. B10D7B]MCW2409694.1 GNAT superfamily N-acetyltransferase [Sphingobium xanthum]